MSDCPHRVIGRKKGDDEEIPIGTLYACVSCGQLFEVKELRDDPPPPREPMFPKNPIPWGLRPRQA